MRTYTYQTTTALPADVLFAAITDIGNWPAWDHELEDTRHGGGLAPHTPFSLQPRGGPRVAMEVVAAEAPRLFVDMAHLPLAKMRTSHQFTATAAGTEMRVGIEVWGPLGFLWDRIVARKMAAEAAEHASAFLTFAAQRGGCAV